MDDVSGVVAFVTGGAGGIGLGIAEALAGAGARIALADRDEAELARAVEGLAATGADVVGVGLDVTDRAAWDRAVAQVHAAWGPVQVLVNNAGVSTLGVPIAEVEPDLWDKVVQINLTGVYNGVRAFLPDLVGSGRAHLVNTASLGGLTGLAGLGPYSATKAAVIALSETLRAELADQGVGVSVLCPGPVRSRLWRTSRVVRGLPDVESPPDDISGQSATADMLPSEVGARVLDAILTDQPYVMTHPAFASALVEDRTRKLLAAGERATSLSFDA